MTYERDRVAKGAPFVDTTDLLGIYLYEVHMEVREVGPGRSYESYWVKCFHGTL